MGVSATISKEAAVNPFVEHHQQSIRFQYSCFDRMLLNAVVQTMQQPPMIVGFLDKCRQVPSITKAYFREVSEDYHRFVGRLAATQRIPIMEPPKGVRRENWVEPFYQRFGARFGIVVILKSRENARVAVSYRAPAVVIASLSRHASCGSITSTCATRSGAACS